VASYTPSNAKLDGSFRKLSVECRGDGLKVQVRKGYYASHRRTSGQGIGSKYPRAVPEALGLVAQKGTPRSPF